jgi:hypothetical protein
MALESKTTARFSDAPPRRKERASHFNDNSAKRTYGSQLPTPSLKTDTSWEWAPRWRSGTPLPIAWPDSVVPGQDALAALKRVWTSRASMDASPPIFFPVLAPQLWAGEGPCGARSGRGVFLFQRMAGRGLGRESPRAARPGSATQAVALRAAVRRPQSKGQKANHTDAGTEGPGDSSRSMSIMTNRGGSHDGWRATAAAPMS